MEQLEEELTCPICCCLFEDPRVLLCSHSFCKKCLEGLLLEGTRGAAFRAPLKCPTCRKETPHNGSNSLQVNYSLRGIVEKYGKIRTCPKMSACEHHCGQPLNIFCATDLRLICGFCATTDAHRGHRFSSLEEAFERERASFEELRRGVEGWQSARTLSCLEALRAEKKSALRCVGRDAEKVTEYFDKLSGAVECKRNEILSDLETLKLVVMQAYDPDIARLRAALEEQERALAMAESFRSVTDPLRFLQQMQELRAKFRLLTDTPLPTCKDVGVGALARNFDVHKWDSLRLGEVDKISVPHEKVSYGSGCARVTASGVMTSLLRLSLVVSVAFLSTHVLATSTQLQVEPLITALTSQLCQSALLVRELAASSTSLLSAGHQCFIHAMDSTVKFFGFDFQTWFN